MAYSWLNPRNWMPGESIIWSKLNQISNDLNYLYSSALLAGQWAANISVTGGGFNASTFNGVSIATWDGTAIINITAATGIGEMQLLVLENGTGADIRFATGGNIEAAFVLQTAQTCFLVYSNHFSAWTVIAMGNYSTPPGTIITSTSKTSDYTTTATTFAGSTDFFTAVSFTADGTSSYLLEFTAAGASMNTASGTGQLWWSLDGNQTGAAWQIIPSASGEEQSVVGRTIWTPAAGSHTATLRGQVGGSYTLTVHGGSAFNGFSPSILTVTVL
jgi:hypothetical protein